MQLQIDAGVYTAMQVVLPKEAEAGLLHAAVSNR
jgi:hypothetical protein